jgi:hypothetical protein
VIPLKEDEGDTAVTLSSSDNSESGRDADFQTGRDNEAADVVIDIPASLDTKEDSNTPEEPVNPKLMREMKRLGSWFNPPASRTTT